MKKIRTSHECPQCGHKVKYEGDLVGPVEHLPDGRHKYTVTIGTGSRKPTFK